jgi:hypothetical protein
MRTPLRLRLPPTPLSNMGSSSSKPARALGSSVSQAMPSAAGASSRAPAGAAPRARAPPQAAQQQTRSPGRTQLGADQSRTAPKAQRATAEASESKTSGASCSLLWRTHATDCLLHALTAIMADARDPQLLANLAKLGPVQVPRHKLRYRPVSCAVREEGGGGEKGKEGGGGGAAGVRAPWRCPITSLRPRQLPCAPALSLLRRL